MANIPRAYSVSSVFQGPSDLYLGITAPASSLYPNADTHTLVLDASGQPTSSTGEHVGSIEGPTTISITEKVNEIMDDQHESAVDVGFVSIEAELDFTLKETNLSRLKTLLTASSLATRTALAATEALQFGGQFTSAYGPTTLLLVSGDRLNVGKWLYVLTYRSYLKSAVATQFARAKESTYKLKMGIVMDVSRAAGDELMHFARTK